jgi:hypothetical protein
MVSYFGVECCCGLSKALQNENLKMTVECSMAFLLNFFSSITDKLNMQLISDGIIMGFVEIVLLWV